MPVRFQVDPDFYDHPKSIGLSDAATALWVRAGSYSAAKLLDGFIAEHVLSSLSRSPEEASSELVARGLWRRTRGGFQFHQYGERNLTKAQVEAEREADRERKRSKRAETKQLVRHGNVRPDSDRTPTGLPQESEGNPPYVVSVSELSNNPPTPRKRGSSTTPTDDDPDWREFWSAYPRKVGKGQARKAWVAAIRKAQPAVILAGAKAYAIERRGQDETFTAHPATWLNGERWTDQREARAVQHQQPAIEKWW